MARRPPTQTSTGAALLHPSLDSILKQDYKPIVLFTEGRSREASTEWRRLRRLRLRLAISGSGGWANAVRPTLRSGRMCNDAISGGAAAGFAEGSPSGFLQRFLAHLPGGPRIRPDLQARGAEDKCHRQRRAAGPDRNRRAWDAVRLLLKLIEPSASRAPSIASRSLNQSR